MAKEQWIKILKGAGIALGGALLTYLASIPESVNFGEYQPIVVAVFSVLINMGRKYLESIKK